MSSIQLKNVNHSFDTKLEEVGVTIRRGEKWAKYIPGTKIELWCCSKFHLGKCSKRKGCICEGEGIILGYWVGTFDILPKTLLRLEHHKEYRNKNKLFEAMKKYYKMFTMGHIITALIYYRTTKI